MANPEHLAILKQGVEVWNNWRQEMPDVMPNLRGSDLQFGNLTNANFSRTDLQEADLSHAKLAFSDFRQANLAYAVLSYSDLGNVNLRQADLTNANLSGSRLARAHLSGTRLIWTNLGKTDFSRAEIGWCVFADVDLTTAEGLADTIHTGPSTVSTDTLRRCQGKVSREFLRGVGVPDFLMAYAFPPANEEPRFDSCFISYSGNDQDFAEHLHGELQANGVRCWFAPHDIQGGRKLHEQIDEAIRVYDRLLLILSEDSMASEWVKTEIANARTREIKEKRQMLFPISLVPFERVKDWSAFDADTGKDSAREIREYYIPDFSNWKDHDSYAAAFQRLLRDLRTEGPNPPSNS